jgi:amidase
VCEYFCCSGGSHTSATGAVENPRKRGRSAGGSSSGSAALVAAGEVDMANGGDQGGSIRIPASYCGVVGIKPTHGLVPYTGIMPIELTLDHTGPMTANVADNALMLEVIAGEDGLDPRQYAPKTARYTRALGEGVKGMKVAVVREGFGLPGAEKAVEAKVKAAAGRLKRLGAKVKEVSLPMHAAGGAIWTPIFCEGATELMMKGNGWGTNHDGLFITSMLDAHSAWWHRADELSETLKLGMLMGHYGTKHYRGRYYAKARNLARSLRAAYDKVLDECDLLLMPTTPMAASKLPGPDASREEIVERAFEMVGNTAPFDATGHPAISVPCGMTPDKRPVGMMLIARHWDEMAIYRASDAFERSGDWRKM